MKSLSPHLCLDLTLWKRHMQTASTPPCLDRLLRTQQLRKVHSPLACLQFKRYWRMIRFMPFRTRDQEIVCLDQESTVLTHHPWLILSSHLNSKKTPHTHIPLTNTSETIPKDLHCKLCGYTWRSGTEEIIKYTKDKFRRQFFARFLNFSISQEQNRNGRNWFLW